jgi:hypothetical protein
MPILKFHILKIDDCTEFRKILIILFEIIFSLNDILSQVAGGRLTVFCCDRQLMVSCLRQQVDQTFMFLHPHLPDLK